MRASSPRSLRLPKSGLLTALERFGTRSVAEVLAAAIGYAERGVPINANLVSSIRSTRDYFAKVPTSAAVFLPGGQVPKEGDLFRMPDLARTFRKLVEAEAQALKAGKTRAAAIQAAYDRFYTGDIAAEIAEFLLADGHAVDELRDPTPERVLERMARLDQHVGG